MGIAEILPGVSGSTFALIMGIYDDFIHFLHDISDIGKELVSCLLGKRSMKSVWKKVKLVEWKFGVLLGVGMLISIGVLSNIVGGLLENYPQYVSAFFFGLVLASVSIPWNEMTQKNLKHYVIIAVVALVTFLLLGINPANVQTSPSFLMLFFGGVVGISGMVLPGISGSFILLLLGLYEYIIGIVKGLTRLNVTTGELLGLAVFSFGLIVGFVVFVRFLKKGLDIFPNELMAVLVGLMFGSLRALYPFFVEDTAAERTRTLVSPLELSAAKTLIIILVALLAIGVVVILNFTTDREQFEKLKPKN